MDAEDARARALYKCANTSQKIVKSMCVCKKKYNHYEKSSSFFLFLSQIITKVLFHPLSRSPSLTLRLSPTWHLRENNTPIPNVFLVVALRALAFCHVNSL